MYVISSAITDKGEKRTHNEDIFLVNDEIRLYVVCDGMGGHAGGEVASQVAVHTIEEIIRANHSELQSHLLKQEEREEVIREHLRHAIRLAGRKIFSIAVQEHRYRGMGTTCVACLVDEKNLYVAHVGDSRCYLMRNGEIQQVTEDHSLVNEQIQAGLITKEEAVNHKSKNVITRSLGYNKEVEVDVQVLPLQVGDSVLLCSDGLCNLVQAEEMLQKVMTPHASLQNVCRQLVNQACERGGDDNITVVLFSVHNEE